MSAAFTPTRIRISIVTPKVFPDLKIAVGEIFE
jgi:hypothetical protein